MAGLAWLVRHGVPIRIAGRAGLTGESEAALRQGFARLFAAHAIPLDAGNSQALVLFPEMDAAVDVPEITTACWDILHKRPEDLMCASARMVVKRRGAQRPAWSPAPCCPTISASSLAPRWPVGPAGGAESSALRQVLRARWRLLRALTVRSPVPPVADLTRYDTSGKKNAAPHKNILAAAPDRPMMRPAASLRRAAFLDVSSLNLAAPHEAPLFFHVLIAAPAGPATGDAPARRPEG